MSAEWWVAIATLVLAIAVLTVMFAQGLPGDDREPEQPEGGPVDADYPPGSNPAGPGAESMDPEDGSA